MGQRNAWKKSREEPCSSGAVAGKPQLLVQTLPLQHRRLIRVYYFCGCSYLYRQRGFATETMWTARPKIVTPWPFKEMFAYFCSRDQKKKKKTAFRKRQTLAEGLKNVLHIWLISLS